MGFGLGITDMAMEPLFILESLIALEVKRVCSTVLTRDGTSEESIRLSVYSVRVSIASAKFLESDLKIVFEVFDTHWISFYSTKIIFGVVAVRRKAFLTKLHMFVFKAKDYEV